jgi:hypothetical protein
MRTSWLILAAALLSAGCASTNLEPTPAELQARWEAQNVFPEHYKQDLLAFLRTYLNDPTHVRDASVSVPVRKTVGPGERFVACLRYNARNGSGKYAGGKEGAAIYVSGKLDRFVELPRDARDLCKDAVYAPFPELQRLQR